MINPRDLPTKAQRAKVVGAIGGTVAIPGTGVMGEVGKRLASSAARRIGSALVRRGVRGAFKAAGRWFRRGKVGVHPGIRAARGGSAITSGKLILGKGQAFRAGGTAFNIGTAAKTGAAAIGVGGAVAIGKVVQPKAAVQVAHSNAAPARLTSPASSSSASSPASSGRQKRCGCPPGQRMLCFKRKHNPEAEAKRRARRKAARASSKAKTAKRTARAKAQAHARKTARHTRAVSKKVRRAARRVTGRKR